MLVFFSFYKKSVLKHFFIKCIVSEKKNQKSDDARTYFNFPDFFSDEIVYRRLRGRKRYLGASSEKVAISAAEVAYIDTRAEGRRLGCQFTRAVG